MHQFLIKVRIDLSSLAQAARVIQVIGLSNNKGRLEESEFPINSLSGEALEKFLETAL